jgi:hypothetical protein
MDKFILSERFRLELKWKQAIYEIEGICKLEGAYFCGPALAEALQLNNNDHIMLDFFEQYMVLVNNVYVAKLSWGEVIYNNDGTISLKDAIITHDTELNRVPKLKDNDYLVIDTENHEVEKHLFNMVYKTFVVNETTNLYMFGR